MGGWSPPGTTRGSYCCCSLTVGYDVWNHQLICGLSHGRVSRILLVQDFATIHSFGYFCWTIGDFKSFTESSHKVPADCAGGLVEKPLFLLCFPSRMGDSQSQVRLSQGDAFLVILSNAIEMYWTVWVSCSNMFKDALGSSRNVGGSLSKYQHPSA